MVSYPELTPEQQKGLPELIAPAVRLPQLFEDSTHQLWQCDTVDGTMILKCCNHDIIQQSSFWQGMNDLFDAQFPDALGHINDTYQLLHEHSPLKIARPVAYQSGQFVLSEFLQGERVDHAEITDEMVEQLAQQSAALHAIKRTTWGSIHQANFVKSEWSPRLSRMLSKLIESQDSEVNVLVEQAREQAAQCVSQSFVPVMIDLRWDQFLQQQGRLSAVVDLDAFVYAPAELEWVLLEYLLDDAQAAAFKGHYQRQHTIPDLQNVRLAYRLVLFLMNVLGEADLKRWMTAPTRF